MKTLIIVPERRNCDRTIIIRETYNAEFQRILFDVGESRMVFIDEVGYKVSTEQKFTLHCPSHYPNYGTDDNFFVEADSGLQLWCNALNEYLLDSVGQLSLSNIL